MQHAPCGLHFLLPILQFQVVPANTDICAFHTSQAVLSLLRWCVNMMQDVRAAAAALAHTRRGAATAAAAAAGVMHVRPASLLCAGG